MLKKNFLDILLKFKIEEIDIRENMKFDPNLCIASSYVDSIEESQNEYIAKIISKGYTLKGNILIPCNVVVYKTKN